MEIVQVNSIKAWLLAARPKTLAGAATPVLLGCALAYADSCFQMTPALLCFAFAFLMQIVSGVPKIGPSERGVRAGKTEMIQSWE